MYDVIIVGSGPAGLSCALALQKENINYLVIEKGTITNSIYKFPIAMIFFTTKELIEIGNYPLNIFNSKPTREEALNYYGQFVKHNKINIHTFEEVKDISGSNNKFTVKTINTLNKQNTYKTKKIVLATGVFDNPRMLNIPGENLNKVSHYFKEPHPYINKNVIIIGGRNSAAEAALEIYRRGGNVTIIHRKHKFSHLKYWVEPDIINRIEEKSIKCLFNAKVINIKEKVVIVKLLDTKKEITIKNDLVLAMTGYQPNQELLKKLNVKIEKNTLKPIHNTKTFETNINGIYIAGVIVAGNDSGTVFIENGRFHGEQIAPNIAKNIKETKI